MKKYFLTYFLIGFFSFVSAQIAVNLSKNKIKVGEAIKFSIYIKKQNSDSLSIYPLDTIPNFNIINISERNLNTITAKEIEFTSFEPGTFILPSFKVVLNKNTYNTPTKKIVVADVKVDESKQGLYDIKNIFQVNYSLWNYVQKNWIIGAIIYLIGVISFILYLLYKTEKEIDDKIYKDLISPYDEAIISLEKINKRNIIKKEDPTDLYVALSYIIKRFIGRKYKINYAERLTEEFVDEIQEKGILTHEQNLLLNNFLTLSDLVKFAKYQPNSKVREENFQQILSLIELHKPFYNLNDDHV